MEKESNASNVSINVLIAQAKQEYTNIINQLIEKYGLPASIWSMILADILNQVNEVGKQELARDLEAMKKENNQEKEDNKDGK